MSLQFRIGIVIWAVVAVITVVFSYHLYTVQQQEFIHGIDEQLAAGAAMTQSIVGSDYHNGISNEHSVPPQVYLRIVDTFNKICRQSNFQYLWSNLILADGTIVFTSGTSTSKDVTKGDHASFFEVHSDPAAFQTVIQTRETTYSTFHNEWGRGRMVLVPYQDSLGRTYLLGASISLAELDEHLQHTATKSIVLLLLMLTAGSIVSYFLARAISGPIRKLTMVTGNIATGDYQVSLGNLGGGSELQALAANIESMSDAILSRDQELRTQQRELDAIVENIPNMLFVKEAGELRFSRFNRAGEQLLGIPREEMIGKNDFDFFPTEQAEFFVANDREVL